MTGRIRLACRDCDTDVCDGINEIPADWKEVIEVQSFDEASAPVDPSNKLQRLTDWYTHLGLCPDCQQEGKRNGLSPIVSRAEEYRRGDERLG